MPHICNFCDEPASKKCLGCAKVWYCSQECQRKGWARHIFDCKRSKPIPTAYYLCRAAFRDILPDHPQTLEDYGFSETPVARDQTMLFGLYRGLFVNMEVEPTNVHKWRKQGVLVQEIKNLFEKLPPQSRGQYYPWFLNNQHLLDPSWKPSQDMALDMMKKTWEFIGADPNVTSGHWDVIKSWPDHKQKCFILYYLTIHGWHPGPEQDPWTQFGFCVCPSQWHEMQLSKIYTTIVVGFRCPLDDFAEAYNSRVLFKLFGRYGLEEEARRIKYLDHIIDCFGRESSWDLKAWVYREDLESHVRSIEVDYGMISCAGNIEYLQLLKRTYKKVFEHPQGDAIELHKACIRGQTFAYVEGLIKIKKSEAKILRPLMKNFYPLPEM